MAEETLSSTVGLWRFKEANNTFTGTCNIVYTDEHKLACTIKGLAVTIDSVDRRELTNHLISKGVIDCYYERRKNGYTLHKRWSLKYKCKVTKK